MRPLHRVVTVVVTILIGLGVLAVPAFAAAPTVVSSSPAMGALIKTKPTGVSVTFSAPISIGSSLSVAGPGSASPCTTTSTSASATISCSFTGVPTATVPDGQYTVTYNANPNSADALGGSYLFTLDTTAPVAPTGLTATPSPYLASSDTETVTGTTELASDTVSVSLAGGKTVTRAATVNADRTFSATFAATDVATLSDGTVTASATSTDLAGNTGTAATKTLTKDTSRPTVASSTPADGGSAKPAGFSYTATASEALAATSRIQLFDSTNTQLATGASVVSGSTVKVTPTGTLADGAYTAKVFLVDANGNPGNPNPSVRTFTIDGTSPAAPVITTPLAFVNVGNAGKYPVAGTGEAGAMLTLTLTGGSGAVTVTKTVVVAGDGSWSTTIDASSLPEGSVSVTASQVDAAGNASGSTMQTTTKDTVAPTVTGPAVTPATMGPTTLTATVSGTVDNGSGAPLGEADKVTVSADDAGNSSTAPIMVSGTASSAGAFSFGLDTSSLSDGTITYTYVATDAAGNASTAVTTTNVKDTTAPAAPTVSISPKPINKANQAAITIAGSAGGTSVSITATDRNGLTVTTTATVTSNAYSKAIDTTSLADGPITVTVTTTDAGGNTSAAGTASTTKDVVAPTTTLSVPAYVNASAPSTLTASGTSEAGATIAVKVTDSATPAGTSTATVTVPASGQWTIDVNVASLAQGTLTVLATPTDTSGNTAGTGTMRTSTKDTVAPDQPATLSGTPSPYTTGTFTVSGTTSTNDRAATDLIVDVVVRDVAGTTVVATAQPVAPATGAQVAGTFSVAFTQTQMAALKDGPLTITALFHDAAGNTGQAQTATAEKGVLALVGSSPANGATVMPPSTISATYNQPLSATGTGTTSTITVRNTVNGKAGNVLAGTTSISGSTITFTPSSPLSDAGSPYRVSVTAYDRMYTNESSTDAFTFTVDSTPPAAPVVSTVTNPVTSANQTSVVVTGTAAEANRPVTVSLASSDAVVSTTVTSGADKTFTATLNATTLADGTVTASATETDVAGNVSAVSNKVTATKDTTAPTVTSSSPADKSTVQPPSTISLTFSESLGSGSITLSPAVSGTSQVSGRTVTFTPSAPLAEGTYTASASVTDAVGNAGSGSSTFTVDSTGPTVTGLTATATASAQQRTTVTGSTEGGASVLLAASDGTRSVSTRVTAGQDGSFSGSLDLTGFADGTITVTAVATDAVGNAGPTAMTTTTRDATGPSVTGLAATATNSAQQSTTVTGSTEPGASVVVSASDGTKIVSKTVAADGSGAFSATLDLTGLADGTTTVKATATDASGNAGPTATTATTRDTTAPGVTDLSATTTSSTRQSTTVSGSTEAGDTVAVSATDGTRTVSGTATASNRGAFSLSLDLTGFADGTITVTAQATDAAGNAGPTSSTTTTRDTTGPSVTGLAATATSSNQQSTTVTGSTEAGATLAVSATDGTRAVSGAATADGSGAFTTSLDLTGLADGTVTVTVQATDAVGNVGPASMTSTTRDITGPTVTGLAGTATTAAQQTTTVTGSTEAGASVTVSATDGAKMVSRTVTADANGSFSGALDLTGFADGTVTVKAVATDVAGNVGPGASASTTRDTHGPSITGLAATDTNATQQSTTITGTTEPGATVAVSARDNSHRVTGTTTADSSGAFSTSLDLTGFADGTITVNAVATDTVGNTGPGVVTTAQRDTTAPSITGLTATDTTHPHPFTTVTGTRSETSSVAVSATDGTHTVMATDSRGDGTFTAMLDTSTFADGAFTVTATATDLAGNTGAPATTTATRSVGLTSSTTTIDRLPGTVVYGTVLDVTGTVTHQTAATYGTVHITATTTTGSTVDLGNVPVAADGTFSRSLTPSVNASYLATYSGDAANNGSSSRNNRVAVAPKVTASSARGKASKKAVVKGTATPGHAGMVVTLYKMRGNGTRAKIATTKLTSGRQYALTAKLPRGATKLVVVVASNVRNAAGSATLTARRS